MANPELGPKDLSGCENELADLKKLDKALALEQIRIRTERALIQLYALIIQEFSPDKPVDPMKKYHFGGSLTQLFLEIRKDPAFAQLEGIEISEQEVFFLNGGFQKRSSPKFPQGKHILTFKEVEKMVRLLLEASSK